MRALAVLALAVLALAGCSSAPPGPAPEPQVCGTIGRPPVRIADLECDLGRPDSRWYYADTRELDGDDYTGVGEILDDDYFDDGDRDTSTLIVPPRTTPPRATRTPTTTAPKATPRPRSTAPTRR